jgi:hypothetical protein
MESKRSWRIPSPCTELTKSGYTRAAPRAFPEDMTNLVAATDISGT